MHIQYNNKNYTTKRQVLNVYLSKYDPPHSGGLIGESVFAMDVKVQGEQIITAKKIKEDINVKS